MSRRETVTKTLEQMSVDYVHNHIASDGEVMLPSLILMNERDCVIVVAEEMEGLALLAAARTYFRPLIEPQAIAYLNEFWTREVDETYRPDVPLAALADVDPRVGTGFAAFIVTAEGDNRAASWTLRVDDDGTRRLDPVEASMRTTQTQRLMRDVFRYPEGAPGATNMTRDNRKAIYESVREDYALMGLFSDWIERP
jgi:hypothetical protein